MLFKPQEDLILSYQPGKHLPGSLTIKNTTASPMIFKFKASTQNKFSIKPNPGMIKPGEEIKVAVFVHRDVVQNLQNQQIQILYGVKEYSEHKNFGFLLQNGSKKDQLNLTIMVEEKQGRVKRLQEEMSNYRSAPTPQKPAKKPTSLLNILLVGVVGLLLGYFSPVSIFG